MNIKIKLRRKLSSDLEGSCAISIIPMGFGSSPTEIKNRIRPFPSTPITANITKECTGNISFVCNDLFTLSLD